MDVDMLACKKQIKAETENLQTSAPLQVKLLQLLLSSQQFTEALGIYDVYKGPEHLNVKEHNKQQSLSFAASYDHLCRSSVFVFWQSLKKIFMYFGTVCFLSALLFYILQWKANSSN